MRTVRARRFAFAVAAAFVGLAVAWLLSPSLVDAPEDISTASRSWGTRFVDSRGRLLRHAAAPDGTRGRPLALDGLGERIVRATIVAEDRRFYEHDGFDPRAAARASYQAISNGRIV